VKPPSAPTPKLGSDPVAFRNTAAELTRQYNQNRSDIEFLHELVEKTNGKVDNLATDVNGLKTQVSDLTTQVDERFVQVEERFDQVDKRFDQVDKRFDRFEERFDRLEQLIALPLKEREAATDGPMRTQQEKKISLLETKMDIYSRRTSDHIEELKRHNQMFDTLDSQMAEVLSILRTKSA
jgi:chromosome segregation ATPase